MYIPRGTTHKYKYIKYVQKAMATLLRDLRELSYVLSDSVVNNDHT